MTQRKRILLNHKRIYFYPGMSNWWKNDETYPWRTWMDEVTSDNTRLGYWEWVENQRNMEEEKLP